MDDPRDPGAASTILKHAARRGIISSNPFDRLERGERPRTVRTAELRVLLRDEVEALLRAAPPRYRVALATAIFTGMRRAELLGLRWCDTDLSQATITVRYQLDRRTLTLVEPKTPNAKRTIALPRFLTQLLAEHRLASPHSRDVDYVFCTSKGTPMDARNFVRRSLTSALNRANLVAPGQPGIRFHDLRHTYASMMIALGENVVYVSRQLGHPAPRSRWGSTLT